MLVRKWTVVGVVLSCVLACGDDKDSSGGGGAGGGSYDSIADSIAKPTGQLSQANAVNVAEEYEKISVAGAGGIRLAQSQNQKVTCPAGGSYEVTASGSQSSGHAVIDYNSCCYSAGCCMNGAADWYYAAQSTAAYQFCGSYDIDYSCSGQTAALEYEGCMGADNKWVFSVEYNGKTYAVSGTYHDGNGTLTIKDADSTLTCTYTNGKGSCTGSGESFSF